MFVIFIDISWTQAEVFPFILFIKNFLKNIMLLISYDIANDKTRTKFAKFIKKYGRRLQYSVYEIKNSERILDIIKSEIEYTFEPIFGKSDSVYIFPISKPNEEKIIKYGWPADEDDDFVFI